MHWSSGVSTWGHRCPDKAKGNGVGYGNGDGVGSVRTNAEFITGALFMRLSRCQLLALARCQVFILARAPEPVRELKWNEMKYLKA